MSIFKKKEQPQTELKKITCEEFWKKYEKFYATKVIAKLYPYNNFVGITKEEYIENEVLFNIGLDLGIFERDYGVPVNTLKNEKNIQLVKEFRDKLLKNPDKILYYETHSIYFSIDGIYYDLNDSII